MSSPSFNLVNFSLRANKAIQRSLVFQGLNLLRGHLDLEGLIYIGLGSIWFTDVQMAHKMLGIKEMVSIEADPVGYKRAKYNLPFKTARVIEGLSTDILPTLFADDALTKHPWFIWMDYTCGLEESVVEDIRRGIDNAPPNTIFVTSFNAMERNLGAPVSRPQRLKNLLGSVVPDDLSRDQCFEPTLSLTLLKLTGDFMISVAAASARPGGFIPSFHLAYSDTTPMVTVGGVLPAKGAVSAVKTALGSPNWPAIDHSPITIPPLTLKEFGALQAEMPRSKPLTRRRVQQLGFDLEDEHIRCFEKYYKYYPVYVQIQS